MDLNLPDISGSRGDAARSSRSTPAADVLVLTMFEDAATAAALRAGARGYLLKGAARPDLSRADDHGRTRRAAGRCGARDPRLPAHLLGPLTAPPRRPPRCWPTSRRGRWRSSGWSPRGLSNPEVGRSLFLAEKTVRNNVSSIFTKLQVADRSEAIVRARRAGLGVDEDERR